MDSTGTAVRPVNDRRTIASVGRQARLELVFARRSGRTVLAHAYAEPPFRVGRSFPQRDGAHMILAWSAPGIFGGDGLEQRVHVERGARVRLTSQSALQAHPSVGGAMARLRSSYQVDEEGELRCDWDPLIPFAGSRLDQRIDINLAENATLFWSDAFMAGRVGSRPASVGLAPAFGAADGERWAFTELSHELRVVRAGLLEYLERYRIAPCHHPADRAWIAGASSYVGTVLASGWAVEAPIVTALHEELSRMEGVRAAADRLDRRVCLVRALADSGEIFREARRAAARALAADGTART